MVYGYHMFVPEETPFGSVLHTYGSGQRFYIDLVDLAHSAGAARGRRKLCGVVTTSIVKRRGGGSFFQGDLYPQRNSI